MASRLLHLRKLMRNERLVIALLRGGTSGRLSPSSLASFEALSLKARETGLKIMDPSACYAAFDETRLLSWLALLQRQNPLHLLKVDQDFGALLRLCANGLQDAGVHLDYRAINRHLTDNNGAALPVALRLSFPSDSTVCKQGQ
jgi:hypothetical protein